MLTRASALAIAAALLLGVACGNSGNGNKNRAVALKELHDPKTAPTATLPAAAPTALPAGNVGGALGASGPQPDTYIVKSGDTLGAIAASLGVSVDDLAKANGITDPARIQIGQQLRVPKPGAPTPAPTTAAGPAGTASAGGQVPPTGGAPSGAGSGVPAASASPATSSSGSATQYTVKPGDNACAIAIANNISLQELADANGVTKEQLQRLSVGQLLKIPPGTGHRAC